MERNSQSIVWPSPGSTELVESVAESARAGHAVVEARLSVSNPGTERARYLQLPNAAIGFPHVPGFGAVGHVIDATPGVQVGDFVAVRAGTHQRFMTATPDRLRLVPDGAHEVDAALWQMGLIAMHGLGMGRSMTGEPLTVVGCGLVGAMARRIAIARGASECMVVAASTSKLWSISDEPGTSFALSTAMGQGHRRHSLVVDATGTAQGLEVAVSAVADGGRVVLLGSPRTPTSPVPMREIYERGISLIGAHIDTLGDASANADEDLLSAYTSEYFSLIGARRLSLADLVTVYTPRQAEMLYRQLVDDRSLLVPAVAWRNVRTTSSTSVGGPALRSQTPDTKLRFGLVGCGDIGFQNAEAIARSAGAELLLCFDTDSALSATLGQRMGARPATSLTELLGASDVDAILVATPHDTHEQIAFATLDAGKHLLLQKPLAADLAAARRIAQAAGAASSTASVLMPSRYESAFRYGRKAYDEGLIGQPLGIVATYLVDKPPSYYRGGYSMRSASTWRLSKQRSGGGIIIMNLLHHLDVARSLLNAEAEWVFAQTLPSSQAEEIEGIASVMVGFDQTIATFVGAASVPGPPGEQLRLWGTAGHCVVFPKWHFTSAADSDAEVTMRPEPRDPQVAAIDSFVRSVRTGQAPEVTIEDALAVQAIVAAAYESARTGQTVRPADLLCREV